MASQACASAAALINRRLEAEVDATKHRKTCGGAARPETMAASPKGASATRRVLFTVAMLEAKSR
jgi:hypothetical protein